MRPSVPGYSAILAAALALLIACCSGRPVAVPETYFEPATTERTTEAEQPGVCEQSAEVHIEPEAPAAESTTEPVAEPSEAEIAPAVYPSVEDIYSRTFDELKSRILEWDALIARKDYDRWYSSLSRAYIAEREKPRYLAEVSRSQRLRDKGIALKSLRDYFLNVVVPARVDAGLDRIEFVDEGEVKAYAVMGGEPAILYYVVKEDGVWKIGTGEECRTASRTE